MRARLMPILLLLSAACADARPPEADCLDCHAPASGRAEAPLIEGQHGEYLLAQLMRFRDRHRDSFPMSALTAGFSDVDARLLADRLARRPWSAVPSDAPADAVERGRLRAESLGCADCHGRGFLGGGGIPRVAGQRAAYLERQIAGFGAGQRHHPPTGTGARMYELQDADPADLAAYLAGAVGSP